MYNKLFHLIIDLLNLIIDLLSIMKSFVMKICVFFDMLFEAFKKKSLKKLFLKNLFLENLQNFPSSLEIGKRSNLIYF